jgi:hypothetical protein
MGIGGCMIGKITKDGKTANITIRVTEELRKRVESLWKRDYSAIPFNSFLGYLVEKGADEEGFIANYREMLRCRDTTSPLEAPQGGKGEGTTGIVGPPPCVWGRKPGVE